MKLDIVVDVIIFISTKRVKNIEHSYSKSLRVQLPSYLFMSRLVDESYPSTRAKPGT